ncbi:putative RTA1 like protein-domain-containing protein [Seiridium cardinale]|uniref:RTA1 like protein-domain-containing protein n=1 Tax=Seiridium cardinale TaxID=138064 RepID=A0ABR2XI40_9PEZI
MLIPWNVLVVAGLALGAPTTHYDTPTSIPPRQITTTNIIDTSVTPTGTFMTTIQNVIPGVTNDHVTIPAETINIVIPTCIQTITPDPNGYVPPGTCGALWDYYPSFIAAIVFATIFGILTLVHLWQAAHYKKGWCWVIIMASIWELCAFTFRAISTRFQQSVGIYLVFQIFILLAPLWVNAFAYMTLGRMINFFLIPSRSLFRIPAYVIAAIFVSLDFVSFVIQLVGGSMSGPTSSAEDQLRAIHIYMGGIGMQEIFIVGFLCLAVKFQREIKRDRNTVVDRKAGLSILYALYFSLTMITVRIIYRLIEFSSGSTDNSLTRQESYFYALEATPMVLAIAVFNVVHPAATINGPDSEMPGLFSLAKDGIRSLFERRQSGKATVLLEESEEQELPRRYRRIGN